MKGASGLMDSSASLAQEPNDPNARPAPLYLQVGKLLVGRIASGAWKPGELIPSEMELARELGVSQGTVRKAIIGMEAQRLVVRYQGRGTYVAQHTSSRTLFHFFRLFGADGSRALPTSLMLSRRTVAAAAEERRLLQLDKGARVHAITRLRRLNGQPAILERVAVPETIIPGLRLPIGREMEEELYVIYQRKHDVTVARADEQLTAVAAGALDARYLGVDLGAPLLQILRVALDVEGKPVELRRSRCVTGRWHYRANVI